MMLLQKFSKQFKNKLTKFINSKQRNVWIETDYARIYVRKSIRLINKTQYDMLDLANISVVEEFQGQGIFKKSIEIMELYAKNYKKSGILVESILNSTILNHLDKIGYKNTNNFNMIPDYYKLPDN